jgi:hypothetical protein
MNDEDDPKQNEPAGQDKPTGGHPASPQSQDAAARAVAQAKEGLSKGVTEFKRLDRLGQLYLGGLGVVIVFGLLFDVMSVEASGAYKELVGHVGRGRSLAGAGNTGLLAYLGAVAGIGIYIWNLKSPIKPSWVPMALAGCAGGSLLLMFLATRGGGDFGMMEVSRSLLGFWLPFLGAAAATGAAVKPILDARPKAPSSPTPPPPPLD